MPACIFCGGDLRPYLPYTFKSAVFRKAYGGHDVCECLSCGLRQVDRDRVDEDQLDFYYRREYRSVAAIANLAEKFSHLWYQARAEALAALVGQHRGSLQPRAIFEVGAGHGVNLVELGKLFPDATLFTDEVDETIDRPAGIAQRTLAQGPYDIVVMSHVLEHFADPVGMIDQAVGSLVEGGLLVVEVPNETPQALAMQSHVEPHLTFFDATTLRALLARAGDVEIVDLFTAGPRPRSQDAVGRVKQMLRVAGNRTPGVRRLMALRRSTLELDFATRVEGGVFLRAVVRNGPRAGAIREVPAARVATA